MSLEREVELRSKKFSDTHKASILDSRHSA